MAGSSWMEKMQSSAENLIRGACNSTATSDLKNHRLEAPFEDFISSLASAFMEKRNKTDPCSVSIGFPWMEKQSSAEKLTRDFSDGTATSDWRNQRSEVPFGNFVHSMALAFFGKSNKTGPCFASISSSAPEERHLFTKKIEHYTIHKVKGDGRCMFRALALGMAFNYGVSLSSNKEQEEADNLRLDVEDVLCSNEHHRQKYEEALIAITIDESMERYCRRIKRANFWGGESELLVLSRMYQQPIIVYIPECETRRSSHLWGRGFVPIAEYGTEFVATKNDAAGKPVRLLFRGSNHYDLLV